MAKGGIEAYFLEMKISKGGTAQIQGGDWDLFLVLKIFPTRGVKFFQKGDRILKSLRGGLSKSKGGIGTFLQFSKFFQLGD